MDETDVPAQCAQARQDARLPQADVDQGRSRGDPVASCEGAPAPVGVTRARPAGSRVAGVGRIRSRRTFAELRRPTGRGRHGAVAVAFLDRPGWERSEVAYAVNRSVGNAVRRNRLRRRMRAIVAEWSDGLRPGAYVVHGGPEAPALEFRELRVAMSRAIEKATNRAPSGAVPNPRVAAGPVP